MLMCLGLGVASGSTVRGLKGLAALDVLNPESSLSRLLSAFGNCQSRVLIGIMSLSSRRWNGRGLTGPAGRGSF